MISLINSWKYFNELFSFSCTFFILLCLYCDRYIFLCTRTLNTFCGVLCPFPHLNLSEQVVFIYKSESDFLSLRTVLLLEESSQKEVVLVSIYSCCILNLARFLSFHLSLLLASVLIMAFLECLLGHIYSVSCWFLSSIFSLVLLSHLLSQSFVLGLMQPFIPLGTAVQMFKRCDLVMDAIIYVCQAGTAP